LIVLDQMVEVWFDIAHLVTPGLYPGPRIRLNVGWAV
jgi:hypothetical protein